jgi:organic hydroperoxide reductase OsmC/OhrA
MHPCPNQCVARAIAPPEGDLPVSGAELPDFETVPPAEFDGPGDRWSPETLPCAPMADCFLLSFRSVSWRRSRTTD